ncbi:hypothetical protein GGG16DRAFT_114010 [Schizophyllum commune]
MVAGTSFVFVTELNVNMLERIDTALKRAAEVANLDLQRDGLELSPERLQKIRDQTTLLEDELEFLDLEIAGVVDVPRKLNDLVAVRKKITAQMDIHRSLCAPVHRLFPELLSEIFVYATKSASKTWFSHTSQLAMACKLASIIAVWRRVARGTPLLWTFLVAERERQWNTYLDKIIPLTGVRPLIAYCPSTITTELFVTQPAMHARRWRVATLHSPVRAMVPAETRVEASNLEELTVHSSGCAHPADREVMDFLAMPRIRSLRLHLTNQFGVSQALAFRMPTRLTSLMLSVWLPGIISFDVVGLLSQCGSTLQHLFVLTLEDPQAFFVELLTRFMDNNNPSTSHLTHLVIVYMPELGDEETQILQQCLGRLYRLEELHITDSPIPLDLVRYLILCENTQPALPKLRILSLESLPTPEHKAALRDVYASRRWSRYICGTDTAILLGDPDEAAVAETYIFDSDETSEWSEWTQLELSLDKHTAHILGYPLALEEEICSPKRVLRAVSRRLFRNSKLSRAEKRTGRGELSGLLIRATFATIRARALPPYDFDYDHDKLHEECPSSPRSGCTTSFGCLTTTRLTASSSNAKASPSWNALMSHDGRGCSLLFHYDSFGHNARPAPIIYVYCLIVCVPGPSMINCYGPSAAPLAASLAASPALTFSLSSSPRQMQR